VGDAEIQLMLKVHAATSAYHDRKVLSMLNELRENAGLKEHDADAFRNAGSDGRSDYRGRPRGQQMRGEMLDPRAIERVFVAK
jgi:hypothetical protein